jgi:cellulose synthase/poly-beta-1,6-N-acetylglucosamine synthase-like glycosyltransferase
MASPHAHAGDGAVCLLELDVDGPPPELPSLALDGRRYTRAAVAVRVHGVLLGVTDIDLRSRGVDGEELAARAVEALRGELDEHLRADGDSHQPHCRSEHERFLERAPFASVIVATRNSQGTLGRCLDSLLALDYPGFEILVVDNATAGEGVRTLVESRAGGRARVEYLREERPGVAIAHNRALPDARGQILAFTDDDVVVDPLWLARLARAFELAPGVGCVTGLILPSELESRAQVWIDDYWGFGKGFERRVFDSARQPDQPLYPYTAGVFGSGANMAFSAGALRSIGGFDPALGTGSPALGGDDLAAFFDVIAAGYRLVYEPTAVVRHRHRPEYESLRTQAYGYGVGLSAYLAKTLVDDPRRVLEVAVRVPRAIAYLLSPDSAKNARRPASLPPELIRLERRGMAVGAWAYMRSRWLRRGMYAGATEGAAS